MDFASIASPRFFSPGEIKPGPGFERNQVFRTDDRNILDGSFSGIQKGVVGIIQEDGREAGGFFIDRDGGQMSAFGQVKLVRLSCEQLSPFHAPPKSIKS